MVNPPDISQLWLDELPPLQRLLLAYSPADARSWHMLCWLLDQRLAAVVRRGGDPAIAAIRLAWWDAVLVQGDESKGRGEPLVDAWRREAPAGASAATERLIDGWRLLASPEALTDEDLRAFGAHRGGGLFELMSGREDLAGPGAIWALWDLAAHVRDAALSQRAIAVAAEQIGAVPGQTPAATKPLMLAHAVAVPDVRRGKAPAEGFSLRQYLRLVRSSLKY